jgi:hypothetical protein
VPFFSLTVLASCGNKYYGTNFIYAVPSSLLIAPGLRTIQFLFPLLPISAQCPSDTVNTVLILMDLADLSVFALLWGFTLTFLDHLRRKTVLLAFENLRENISWLISVPERVRALSFAKY